MSGSPGSAAARQAPGDPILADPNEAYRAEVTATHALAVGDRVTFSAADGMTEINNLITAANYSSATNTGANLSYAEVVAAQKTLDDAKATDKRALVLGNGYLSDLRSDASIIAAFQLGANVISTGSLGTIAGAQVYQFSNLSANSESLAGFICGADAIAVATALPFNEIPGAEVSTAVDPATGLAVQVMIIQEQSGYLNVTATLLFGCAVGRATSLRRLTTA